MPPESWFSEGETTCTTVRGTEVTNCPLCSQLSQYGHWSLQSRGSHAQPVMGRSFSDNMNNSPSLKQFLAIEY